MLRKAETGHVLGVAFNSQLINISYYPILVFFVLVLSIGIAGYIFYDNQKSSIIVEKQNELSAIADLKIAQIKYWREEHIRDAQILTENFLITDLVRKLAENPASKSMQAELSLIMQSIYKRYDYVNIIALDAKGKLLTSIDRERRQITADTLKTAMQAVSDEKVILTDIHTGGAAVKPNMDIYVPLMGQKGGLTYVAGILVMQIDPYQFLYPLIENWPTPSPSAETLLVRREGNEVVFLNKLRHKKDTELSLRLPLTQKQLPAAFAVLGGKDQIVEGYDYRNVSVVAATRKVPDSPWFLVSKVDKEEIYASLRRSAMFISIIVIVLIIAAGLSIGLWWWQQRGRYYRKQLEAEVQFNEEREKTARERERLLMELQEALANVKTLSGMLPICAYCKKIRNDKGYWEGVETYITKHTDTVFSHGMCPECHEKVIKELEEFEKKSGQ